MILQDFLRSGGTERQTIFLAKHFRRSGHEVSLLTFRPGGRLSSPWAKNRPDGILLKSLQKFDSGLSFYAPGLINEIARQSPYAVMCMGRMANLYGGKIQKSFPKIRVVGTLRTGKKLSFLSARSLRGVGGIIVNSQWWKHRLEGDGFKSHKIKIIRNSMTLTGGQDESAQDRKLENDRLWESHTDDPACVFLSVAAFRQGKGQDELLKIFSRLDPSLKWRLRFVGDGPNMRRCERLAARLGQTNRVAFLGYIDDPRGLYRQADIAVSASQEDSLPNFLIEAQWYGLPVVAMKYRGIEETFQDGTTGHLIARGDQYAFVKALQNMILHAEKRKQFGIEAQEHARKNFPPQKQAEKTLRFLLGNQ